MILPDKAPQPKQASTVKPFYGLDAEHRQFLDWHRTLGPSYPATDLDVILLEYNHRQPTAFIEIKSSLWLPVLNTANIHTLANLGNLSGLPTFVVQCSIDHQRFTVWPLNRHAVAILPTRTVMQRNNGEYARFLDMLRKSKRSRR